MRGSTGRSSGSSPWLEAATAAPRPNEDPQGHEEERQHTDPTHEELHHQSHTKEDLLLTLIDRHLATQLDEIDEAADNQDPVRMREQFASRVERLMAGLTEPRDLFTPSGEGDALSTIQVQTLSLELLLYVVRYRPELRPALAERYRQVDAQATRVIRHWLDAEGRDSTIAPRDLAVVQSWLIEGLGLRLLMDPELITPARAARLYRTLVTDLPLADASPRD
jgi:hypothetical protein